MIVQILRRKYVHYRFVFQVTLETINQKTLQIPHEQESEILVEECKKRGKK